MTDLEDSRKKGGSLHEASRISGYFNSCQSDIDRRSGERDRIVSREISRQERQVDGSNSSPAVHLSRVRSIQLDDVGGLDAAIGANTRN